MPWFDDKAGSLQSSVRLTELDKGLDYPEEDVRRATVHTRDDVVMLVSYLSSANWQLRSVRRLLMLIAVLLTVVILK
jgi:hypothetical protein